jgi:DNA-binding response OmpR family regulator
MPEKPNFHILIIEDDPGIATNLRRGLEREGYQVSWKDKGEDGIPAAELPQLFSRFHRGRNTAA